MDSGKIEDGVYGRSVAIERDRHADAVALLGSMLVETYARQ
jgi:hypothetical protein